MRWTPIFLVFFLLPLLQARIPDDAEQISAEELRRSFCPQCKPIKTGDFKRFWVIYHKGDNFEYLTQTHLDQPMHEGVHIKEKIFEADFLYPVFSDGQFQPYLVEINDERQLKILQIPDTNGGVKIHPFDGIAQNHSYYCGHSEKHTTLHREKMFFLGPNLILNNETAIDVRTLCDRKVEKKSPEEIMGLEDDGVDYNWIRGCFKSVNGRGSCGFNIDGRNKTHYSQQCQVLYVRNDLVVHSSCTYHSGKRCSYFVYDYMTGTDWYIPDDIQFSQSLVPGFHNIRYLVPLIELDDSFFSNGRRFQYSKTTARPTQKTTKSAPDVEESGDYEYDKGNSPSVALRREVISRYMVIALIVIVYFGL